MTEKAAKALQKSLDDWIELWERVSLAKNREEIQEARWWKLTGDGSCALCKVFKAGTKPSCLGCPVFNKTKTRWCLKTPYVRYSSAIHNAVVLGGSTREILPAIEAEIDFLASLQEARV